MDYYTSSLYIYRQGRQRPWDQRNDPIMVGDLPLKRKNHLQNILTTAAGVTSDDWMGRNRYRNTAHALENLQVLLHLQGQEEREVNLVGGSARRWGWGNNKQTPYHEEIRANWEQFARVVEGKDQLEDMEIKDIVIPPAPFFAEKMVPALQKGSLVRLDLINCNLTSGDFESVAQLIKKVPALISLGLSGNQIENASDAKTLSAAMAKHKVLSFVDLSKCGLNKSEDILPLLLKGSKKLNGLDLSFNKFEAKSLLLIAKFLSTHKAITVLNL